MSTMMGTKKERDEGNAESALQERARAAPEPLAAEAGAEGGAEERDEEGGLAAAAAEGAAGAAPETAGEVAAEPDIAGAATPEVAEEAAAPPEVAGAATPEIAQEVVAAPDIAAAATPEVAEEVAAERALEAELDRLQGELEALNDRHLRLAAEFENYRKRIERERAETWTRAQADLARRILDVLDDLDRVCATDPSCVTAETVVEGVELVRRKMTQSLEQAGLEAFDPAGQAFDPTIMEAVMTAEASAGEDDDTVAEVFQKGYTFRGHLVRPARVVVRKHG